MNIKKHIIDSFVRQSIVLDLETTGPVPLTAEICEIGVVHNNDSISKYGKLFGTIKPIPFSATAINNITRKVLEGVPTFEVELEEVCNMIGLAREDKPYLIAHNIKYDKSVLESNFKHVHNAEIYLNALEEKKWICTLRLAKQLFTAEDAENDLHFGYSLNFLRYAFNLDDAQSAGAANHRAEDDAFMCFLLLNHICNYVLDNLIDEADLTEDFDLGEFLYTLSNETIITKKLSFGKHRSQRLEDIPIDYYNWLLKNSALLDENSSDYDRDLALSIEAELNRRTN